jgi:hypothetical protein
MRPSDTKSPVIEDNSLHGRNSGQNTATFKCNIEDVAGKVCGAERNLLHCKGKAVSTLRILFHLHFFVFKQTASHLAAEANVEQFFSRAGQLSEVNVDPDSLADMVSIMINKHANPLSKISWTSTMRCSLARIEETKQTFFNSPEDVEDSDTDG